MSQVQPSQWQKTSIVPRLQAQDVHLWRLILSASQRVQQSLWRTLSEDEQERAQRFIKPADQQGFVIVRGRLRWLLGQYLGIDPAAVKFSYGTKGKPRLTETEQGLDIRFNLSHSHGMALIAVAPGQDLGIDLEQINPHMDYEGITRRFLTCGEQQALFRRSETERCAMFFKLWTRKEACIKALGGSIASGLEHIDVSADLNQPTTTLQLSHETGLSQRIYVHDLSPTIGYAGALATSFMPHHLHRYRIDACDSIL